MGQSSSRDRRRRRNTYPQAPPPPYPYAHNPYPPPPPPQPLHYDPNDSYSNQLTISFMRFLDSFTGRTTTQYPPPAYAPGPASSGWWIPIPPPPFRHPHSSSAAARNTQPAVPEYVEHETAKTVKNVVNVHKDTIRLDVDEQKPDHHLVSFEFDAMADGSFTIYYFAREEIDCNISPVDVHMYKPTTFPFQKGVGQKFCQPSGSGIDLGFSDLDDLLKPLNGDVFPLVIRAEASLEPLPTDQVSQSKSAACAQITQAIIEKSNNGSFQAKVMKQILWANGERYELYEIFGIADSAVAEAESSGANADDTGKECVICLSEPRNTAVLPCRHMCMCSECAQALRLQSNKCPICRQPVEKLMEIKVKRDDH